MMQIVEIKDNPFWEHDVDEAIYDFEVAFDVKPHMYIGKNFLELFPTSFAFLNKSPADITMKTILTYKGIPCEYDPDISCVILKA